MSGKSLRIAVSDRLCSAKEMRLLVPLPGRSALFESGVVEQALLRQHIVQPDVACPAQVGACAIGADQLWMLCRRGIVWHVGGRHRYSPPTIIADDADWKDLTAMYRGINCCASSSCWKLGAII